MPLGLVLVGTCHGMSLTDITYLVSVPIPNCHLYLPDCYLYNQTRAIYEDQYILVQERLTA
jgi:hypothetical protein